MFGFLNINMRNFPKNNTAIIHQAVDKMQKGNLNVSDILDSDELITDIKSSLSQLGPFFNSSQNVKDLLDFIIKEPTEDEHKRGHKFPFNACEILCSENQSILGKIFDDKKEDEEDEEIEKKDLNKSGSKKKNNDDDDDFDMDFTEMENSKKEDVFDYISGKNNNNEENTNLNKEIEVNDDKFTFDDNENNTNFEVRERADDNNEDDLVNFNDDEKNKEKDSPFGKKEENLENAMDNLNINDKKDENKEEEKPLIGKEEDKVEGVNEETKNLAENLKGEAKEQEKEDLMKKVEEIVSEVESDKGKYAENNEKAKLFSNINNNKDDNEDDDIKEEIETHEDKKEENEDDLLKKSLNNEKEEDDKVNEEKEDTNEDEDKKLTNLKDSLNVSANGELKLDTEILDYFFDFLNTDSSLNFVLCGYFAKIFGHFLNLRQNTIMKYLLVQRPEVLKNFTKHINRKSIVECIYKILISYSEDIPNSMELKIKFLKSVLEAFDPEDYDVIYNISDMIVELFTVRKMYLTFITNNEVFKLIFEFVTKNINNKSFAYLIKILQKANENILKDFGNNLVTPSFTCNETQEMFFNFTYNVTNLISGNASYNSQADNLDENNVNTLNLTNQFNNIFLTLTEATEKIIANFVEISKKEEEFETAIEHFESTYLKQQNILGIRRLNEIEYIRTILEILVNACANNTILENLDLSIIVDKLVSSEFFKYALVS